MSGWFKESLQVYHNGNMDTKVDGEFGELLNNNPFLEKVEDLEDFEAVSINLGAETINKADVEGLLNGSTNNSIDIPKR